MALATRCPYCHTTFRVAQDQLKLRAGIVRCGACKQVFNGIEHLLRPDEAPVKPASPATTADKPAAANPAPMALPGASVHSVPSANTPALQEVAGTGPAVREEFIKPADIPAATPVADVNPSSIPLESDEPTIPVDLLPEFAPAALPPSPLSPKEESGFTHDVEFDLSGMEHAQEDTASKTTQPEPVHPVVAEETKAHAETLAAEQTTEVQQPQFEQARAPVRELEVEHEPPPSPAMGAELADPQVQSTPTAAPALFDDEDYDVAPVAPIEEPSFVKRGRRRQRWKKIAPVLLGLGSLALLVALVLHGAYLFRTPLGTRFPSLKPALAQFCALAQCEPVLAKQIDAVSLESSELQAVAVNKNNFSLSLLLRNRSTLQQTWPNLELTLNDANEQALLRKVFEPREYLPAGVDVAKGFAPDSEQSVKLYFTLTDLKASGYRVFLFYP